MAMVYTSFRLPDTDSVSDIKSVHQFLNRLSNRSILCQDTVHAALQTVRTIPTGYDRITFQYAHHVVLFEVGNETVKYGEE